MEMPKLVRGSAMEDSPTTTETGMSAFKKMRLPSLMEVNDFEGLIKAGQVTKSVEVGVEAEIANVIDLAGANTKTTTGDAHDQGQKNGHADVAQESGTSHIVEKIIQSIKNTESIGVVHPTTITAADQGMSIPSVDGKEFT